MKQKPSYTIHLSRPEMAIFVKFLSFFATYQNADMIFQHMVHETLKNLYDTLLHRFNTQTDRHTFTVGLTMAQAGSFWKYYELAPSPSNQYANALLDVVGSKIHKELNKDGRNMTNDPPTITKRKITA